jgi:cellular nucleic acid-binding protein
MSSRSSNSKSEQREILRKRGWSIHSEGTHESDALTQHEKIELLESMPMMCDDDDDEHELHEEQLLSTKRKRKDNVEAMLYDDLSEELLPVPKRKNDNLQLNLHGSETNTVHTATLPTVTLPELAKARLSKWAARLFDPNRPRGLIETPQIIPLNDTFLQSFGRREKDRDKIQGIELHIPTAIDDSVEHDVGVPPPSNSNSKVTKVKITNLKYTVTEADLVKACSHFGTIESCHLIVDDFNAALNKGFAYVTFSTLEGAKACVTHLVELQGRLLRITIATSSQTAQQYPKTQQRYYKLNANNNSLLSIKCYRCGGVGHMSTTCTNAPLIRPCPLCSKRTHDARSCPFRTDCYNCGVPGHLITQCTAGSRRGMRAICTLCFQSGHDKRSCRRAAGAVLGAERDAVCFVCGKVGHFTCKRNTWFFGLDGVTCSNCGLMEHEAACCARDKNDFYSRNPAFALAEIERQATQDELERRERERGRARQQSRDPRQRVRSMPPAGDRRQEVRPPSRDPRLGGDGGNKWQRGSAQNRGGGAGPGPPSSLDRPLSKGRR